MTRGYRSTVGVSIPQRDGYKESDSLNQELWAITDFKKRLNCNGKLKNSKTWKILKIMRKIAKHLGSLLHLLPIFRYRFMLLHNWGFHVPNQQLEDIQFYTSLSSKVIVIQSSLRLQLTRLSLQPIQRQQYTLGQYCSRGSTRKTTLIYQTNFTNNT